MTPAEYLDACKATLGITSDYELAKRLEIRRNGIPEIRQGKRPMPEEMVFRVALTLELEPSEVLADLRLQSCKTEKEKELWSSFLSRSALRSLCGMLLVLFVGFVSVAGGTGGNDRVNRRRECFA